MSKEVRYMQIPLHRCSGDVSILMELSDAFQKEGFEIIKEEDIITIKKEKTIDTPPLVDENSLPKTDGDGENQGE